MGNINRDIKVQQVPASAALVQDGETSVPAVIETVGGGGANSACAAALLGAQVYFIGKIGADHVGRQLQRTLKTCGIKPCLTADQKCQTGTTVALGYQTGRRHFLSCLPNNYSLRFGDLDLAPLKKCNSLLRADVWFSCEMLQTGNERLLSRAKQKGLITSLDINFDPVWSTGKPSEIRRRKRLIRRVLPLVDMAHGNVQELCEFTEAPDLKSALGKLAVWGAGSVVVHLGKDGAGFFTDGKLFTEPADKAKKAIHSTGTGDVLSVCMILLAQNDAFSIQEKLRVSNHIVRQFMEGRRSFIPVLE